MTIPAGCTRCPHHEVLPDPDRDDWFCDDDRKVYCRLAHRDCAVAVRPYNLERETSPAPAWCPLRASGASS